MALIALLIGAVLIVAAIRNTQGDLLAAVQADVPPFAIWGAAIFGVALVGFVPGLKPVSRGLLALLIVALILGNYRNILAGFAGVTASASAADGGGERVKISDTDVMQSLLRLAGTIETGESADYSDALASTRSA